MLMLCTREERPVGAILNAKKLAQTCVNFEIWTQRLLRKFRMASSVGLL